MNKNEEKQKQAKQKLCRASHPAAFFHLMNLIISLMIFYRADGLGCWTGIFPWGWKRECPRLILSIMIMK